MWVKICGNTRLEDCQRAVELGVDALGFIFAHGKRLVTAEHVRTITSQLPSHVATFGVFTQRDPEFILRTAEAAGITGIQIHGAFDAALASALRLRFPKSDAPRLIQVVHWDVDEPAELQQERLRAELSALADSNLVDAALMDSRTKQGSGGTGVTFDWGAAASVVQEAPLPVIAAGGLRPENVAEAVRVLRPWGVDISSGVESAPGVKDAARMQQFVHAARNGSTER
ncbi:phosphoribosylanthranilate isomerase [Terriglobus sp. RCC_193]|uniref:phosphoribosylanthranilate isomerase n=1 Tax=Terriglobus sp. RCC_193 TaxID=3239218 RepID=UPI0035245FAE